MLLIATRVLLGMLLPLAAEDAYITFRFARSFATGHGLVFNPGQHVLGFTSAPWTLWNALGLRLIHDPVLWSRATSIVADALSLLVITGLLRRHAGNASAWCFAVFFAVWPYFSALAISGMENGVLVALCAIAAVLLARGAWTGGPLLALIGLWRPEGIAAALVLALYARWRERLVALALIASGLIALTIAFGSPIPQSLSAKSNLYGTPGPWAGRAWWEWLVPFPLGRWPVISDLALMLPLTVLFVPAVAAGIGTLWRDRRSPLAAVAFALLGVWAGYAALGVAYFYWYLVVPLAGFAIAASVGLPRLTRSPLVYASAALFVAGIWWVAPRLYVGRAQNEAFQFAATADYLERRARPGESVFLEPIGLIGYRVPVVIVDEMGLVSPDVAKRRMQGPGWYADVVQASKPDWLVVRRTVVEHGTAFAGAGAPFRSPAERDTLLSGYEKVQEEDAESGGNALWIYHRVPEGVSESGDGPP